MNADLNIEEDMLPASICGNCLGDHDVRYTPGPGRRLCVDCRYPDEVAYRRLCPLCGDGEADVRLGGRLVCAKCAAYREAADGPGGDPFAGLS